MIFPDSFQREILFSIVKKKKKHDGLKLLKQKEATEDYMFACFGPVFPKMCILLVSIGKRPAQAGCCTPRCITRYLKSLISLVYSALVSFHVCDTRCSDRLHAASQTT